MTGPHAPAVAGEMNRLTRCVDGKYRWLVEVNLWRDWSIPLSVASICLLAALVPVVLLGILALLEGTFARDWSQFLHVYVLVVGILLGLGMASYYLFYVPLMGGRYPVLFEMDEAGISHIQLPGRRLHSNWLEGLAVLAGTVSGNPAVAGAGLLAAARKSMHTRFSAVRRVVVYRNNGVLKLISGDMTRNLVYLPDADADAQWLTVLIAKRCTGAVVRER